MTYVVQKYGGTSVAGLERMRSVAENIKKSHDKGQKMAVVVSAMAGTTDQLLGLTREAKTLYAYDEHDVIAAAGEQISAGLMALTLQNIGLKARSFLGWQMPCYTDGNYGNAAIESLDPAPLIESIEEGVIPVVAGFQGMTKERRLSTLGRGGSDTTAVALAAAMKAEACEIYTDVDGIYTADPRIVPKARKLDTISYEEMYELADLGAKVLQTRSVELAMKKDVPVVVRSSFHEGAGTLMARNLEREGPIAGIVCSKNEVQATLECDPSKGPIILDRLVAEALIIDMVLTTGDEHLLVTVPKSDLGRLQQVLTTLKEEDLIKTYSLDPRIAKLSVVGLGLSENQDLLKVLFETLKTEKLEPYGMSAGDIKATLLVPDHLGDDLARKLHTVYGLD